MEFVTNNAGELLITLGLVLLIIEAALLGFSTFILTFVGLATVVTGILVYAGSLPVQLMPILLTTAICTTVFALILWKPLKRFQNRQDTHNVKNDFIGMEFVITEGIDAGTSTTQSASESLPMLNRVMSFPTSIIIDRNGEVRRIHTGFSGPATGIYYEEFVDDFNQFMKGLIDESDA